MKTTLRFAWVFIIGVSLFFCVSCSKDLSRSKAEEILKKEDFGGVTQDLRIKDAGTYYFAGQFNCPGSTHQDETQQALTMFKPIEDQYRCLESAGFVTLKKEISDPSKRPQEQYNCDAKTYILLTVIPTSKLEKYITGRNDYFLKLKLINYEFGEIAGISKESDTTRIVQFTMRSKPNELSNCFKLEPQYIETQHRSAYFKLYDDGWRNEK